MMKKMFITFFCLFYSFFSWNSIALEAGVVEKLVERFHAMQKNYPSDHSWPLYLTTINNWYLKIIREKEKLGASIPTNYQAHPLYHYYGAIPNTSFYSKVMIQFSLALAAKDYNVFYVGPFSLTPTKLIKTLSIQTKVPQATRRTYLPIDPILCRPLERNKAMMELGAKMVEELEKYTTAENAHPSEYEGVKGVEWVFEKEFLHEVFLTAIMNMPTRTEKRSGGMQDKKIIVPFLHDHIYEDQLFTIGLESMRLTLLEKNYKVLLAGPGYNNHHHMSRMLRLFLFKISP